MLSPDGQTRVRRDALRAEVLRTHPEWDRPNKSVTQLRRRNGRAQARGGGSRGSRVKLVVQRSLSRLERQGAVRRTDDSVVIVDVALLRSIAAGEDQ